MPDIAGSGKPKQTSLGGIAYKAKQDKHHRFRNLYGCLTRDLLLQSWRSLNKKAAYGVDRVKAEDYEKDLWNNLIKLEQRLKEKNYKAKLIRRKYIPKDGSKKLRPLGIPALEDKIVQGACVKLLNAIYEQDFIDHSYGYRPNTGAKDAISDLTFQLQFGVFGYIVEADIRGFFDNMDHEWLLKMLSERINDKAFIHLIRKWLKAGILEEDGQVIHPKTGTPQGGIISPVLANLYLHYALDLWFEKAVKPQCRGKAIIYRYADDWICAFRFKEDAERFYRAIPKRLAKFNLQVAPEKTQILRFSRFHPNMSKRITFLGFELYWFNDRKGIARVQRRTSRKRCNQRYVRSRNGLDGTGTCLNVNSFR